MKKFIKSFEFAFTGLFTVFKTQQNFRIEIITTLIVIIASIVFKISSMEWLVVLLCITIILSLEILNTALETTCNLFSTEINPSIKIIKDAAAGAVLIASMFSAIIGAIIFLPKIF